MSTLTHTDPSPYVSQAARDACSQGYGNASYWEQLDAQCLSQRDYFMRNHNSIMAKRILTRSLSEALMGNEGE